MTCRLLHLQNEQEWIKASGWLDARYNPGNAVEDQVREFLSAVREKGDDALVEYTRQFDCESFELPIRLSAEDIARGAASVSPESREYISLAAENMCNSFIFGGKLSHGLSTWYFANKLLTTPHQRPSYYSIGR